MCSQGDYMTAAKTGSRSGSLPTVHNTDPPPSPVLVHRKLGVRAHDTSHPLVVSISDTNTVLVSSV